MSLSMTNVYIYFTACGSRVQDLQVMKTYLLLSVSLVSLVCF